MKAITGLVVLLLATLLCRAQQSGQKAETKDKAPDYYPLKVGNKWHYLVVLGNGRKVVFLHQITKVEEVNGKRLARMETVINGEIKNIEQIGVDVAGVFRYRSDDLPITPPACLLKYPVKEGESWTAELKIGDNPVTTNVKVGNIEEVQVPAGKYQAISVRNEMTVDGSPVRITSWYAPEVGMIKQSIERQGGDFNLELMKRETGK